MLCHGMDTLTSHSLIDRSADVNAQKENHWTALHLTSHKGHLDIAKVLIDRGADVDTLTEAGDSLGLGIVVWAPRYCTLPG
jgi:ankyrin repeat protein